MIPSTGPNLAREPFANTRPLLRLSILLWLLALGLGAWNVHAYFASGAGATARRAELERLRSENAESRRRIETLESDLRRADLERVNLQTEYLNQRIAERAFSWNLLFDDLVGVMPRQVRVQRLAPEGFKDDKAARTGRAPVSTERRVSLRISGEAADDEALLDFIDGLFAHPAFDSPNLSSESRTRTGDLDFELTVGYLPAGSAGSAGADDAVPAVDAGAPSTTATTSTTSTTSTTATTAKASGSRPVAPVSTAAGETEAPTMAGPAPAPSDSAAAAAEAGVAPDARAALGRSRPVPAPVAAPARGSSRGEPSAAATADDAAESADRPRAAAPTPTEALSIFGVPLGAKPYASGGLP